MLQANDFASLPFYLYRTYPQFKEEVKIWFLTRHDKITVPNLDLIISVDNTVEKIEVLKCPDPA